MKKVTLLGIILSVSIASCKKDDATPATSTNIPTNTVLTAGTYLTSANATGADIQGKFVGGINKTANHKGTADAAWELDGVDDYIEIADDAKFKPTALTIAVRAYTNGKNFGIIFKSNGQSAFDESYGLFATSSGSFLGVAASGSSEPLVIAKAPYELNKWYHLAVSTDADSIRLYVDGVKQQTTATKFALKHDATPLFLGYYPFRNSFFKGKLTDFKFYNKVLTDSEINTLSK